MLRLKRRPWLLAPLGLLALLWLADRLWPLPLPGDDLARVVLAEDGTPLWRFADHDGVWRYPVTALASPSNRERAARTSGMCVRTHPSSASSTGRNSRPLALSS